MSVVLRPRHFTASKKVFTAEADGLANILRAVAVEQARLHLIATPTPPQQLIDNSAGTAAQPPVLSELVVASAPFNAVSAGGAQLAGLEAALAAADNAHAVIATTFDTVLTQLGLAAVSGLSSGVVAAVNTIPALPKTVAAAAGTAAADYVTGRAGLLIVRQNHQRLMRAMAMMMTALGEAWAPANVQGAYGEDFGLVALPAIAAATDGSSAIAATDASAFALALANNVATLAAAWTSVVVRLTNGSHPVGVVAG